MVKDPIHCNSQSGRQWNFSRLQKIIIIIIIFAIQVLNHHLEEVYWS